MVNSFADESIIYIGEIKKPPGNPRGFFIQ